MALCDQLEAAQAKRKAARDRLTVATLARFRSADADTFVADVRFTLDALPSLTARADQIPLLRDAVLRMALDGRMSDRACWPEERVRVAEVARLQNGYAFKSEWFTKSGVRLLRNTNVGHGKLDWHETACLPSEQAAEYDRFALHEGDVVLSLDRPFISTGTKVAKVTAADLPALLLQRVGRFVIVGDLDPDYLVLWINSPHFSDQIDPGRSNGVPHISSKQVEAATLFVPALVEQRRIVAKVRDLLALCEKLEARLSDDAQRRVHLLDALLRRVVEPAAGSEAPARRQKAEGPPESPRSPAPVG